MEIKLPAKKPRIKQKVQAPDQRTITVCPIRAINDRSLRTMELRTLLAICSFTNKAGVTWVGHARLGEMLNVSRPRITVLLQELTRKGYIKTLHRGFKGFCADTKQVIFDPAISADEAAAITGELAPYQLKKQEIEAREMQKEIDKKQAKTRKRAKNTGKSMPVTATELRLDEEELALVEDYKQFTSVDPSILALALSNLPPSPTPDQIEAELDRLLR